MLINVYLTVCSYHITYAFQGEATSYSCLNVKELLARSRRDIWSFNDCNWTATVYKRILNHLAELAKLASWAKWLRVRLWIKWLWIRVQLQSMFILNVLFEERIRNSNMKKILLEMTFSYTINTTEKKMTICKNNGWSLHQNRKKNPYFYCKQISRFCSSHLTVKKSLKRYTEYLRDVRAIIL